MMLSDAYEQVDKDYSERDFSAGVPRFEIGRITQLTEPHRTMARETIDIRGKLEKALLDSQETKTSKHPLQSIFDDVIAQVANGKGAERHGGGKDFMSQPWVELCDTHGVGFATGQADKKLSEAQGFDDPVRWEREMLGSMAYMAMAILYKRMEKKECLKT